MEIFAPIQAHEAAAIHQGHFAHFEPSIRQRLEWGATITATDLEQLRRRHAEFRNRVVELLAHNDLLLVPAGGMARLNATDDHSQTRMRLLRYTTPFSLAGVPVVTIPLQHGGVQIAALNGRDEELLALAAQLDGVLDADSLPAL
jgi:aspartyl-tRNA(Asn)/glutamyl-tRNA(Gln) amidotransferase subunit A